MVATVEQISRDLKRLESQAAEIALEAHQLYGKYLNVLGRLVAQQLIQAGYNLCTQAYPEAFLALSLEQRQKLQQNLQQLGYQLENALQEILKVLIQPEPSQGTPPQDVLTSMEEVDQALEKSLKDISRQANQLLQAHGILAIKSIDTLFEIATKAEEAGRSITSTPHLLKALIESEAKETKGRDTDPVVAIYLKVADIEFTEPEAMSWRNQLRQLRKRLTNLQRSYDQKQQEKRVTEAIAAWRSSWVSYDPDSTAPQPGPE